MATFVLVHGAWHGGWCWQPTQARLVARGHTVHCPTLTGLGERSHLAHPGITPDTHVEDILAVLRWRELEDVVLVGHSYGGLVITGVASAVPAAIRSLVYLDAFVPETSGVAIFANANPERLAAFEAQTADGGFLVEPDLFDAWTDDPDLKAWLRRQCTPHPIGSFREGVTLSGREAEVRDRHYIACVRNVPSPFQAEYAQVRTTAGWQTHEIDAKHDAMVERPDMLTTLLGAIASEH
ncbi:MAG: alpha/beta hydrolase [Pseudomonadota bacterium]